MEEEEHPCSAGCSCDAPASLLCPLVSWSVCHGNAGSCRRSCRRFSRSGCCRRGAQHTCTPCPPRRRAGCGTAAAAAESSSVAAAAAAAGLVVVAAAAAAAVAAAAAAAAVMRGQQEGVGEASGARLLHC